MPDQYTLTINISGSHFTAAIYDGLKGCLLPKTYKRRSVSHKATAATLLGIWSEVLDEVTQSGLVKIERCIIAVPCALYPSCAYPVWYERYPSLKNINLRNHFALMLNVAESEVIVLPNSVAVLMGESDSINSGMMPAIALSIGTDFSAAKLNQENIEDLKWEFQPFLDGFTNNYLSSGWLLKQYRERTGISLLNLYDMIGLYPESVTVRALLKEFIANLILFLDVNLAGHYPKLMLIEGDLVYAWKYIGQQLAAKFSSIDIKIIRPGKERALAGAYQFAIADGHSQQ